MRKIKGIALLGLFAIGLSSCSSKTLNGVKVLYTNDVHAAFEESDTSIGLNNVAGYREYLKSKNREVGLVDCGDFLQGSTLGILSGGDLPAKLLGEMNYDVASIGNHEFDFGYLNNIGDNGYYKKYNLPYVSLNLKYKSDNKNVFDGSKIVKYGDTNVAYISVLTPSSYQVINPKMVSDTSGNYVFDYGESLSDNDFFAMVQNEIDDVSKNADFVILLTHLGIEAKESKYTSIDLIKNTKGVDVVLDAHSHTTLESENVKDKSGNEVILSSTGTGLQSLGELTIDTNGTKDKSDDIISTKLLKKNYIKERSNNKANDKINEAVKDANDKLKDISGEKLFKSEGALEASNENGVRMTRTRETKIGSLVADGMLAAASEADIAVQNGGGVRAGLKKGDITYGDILTILPYMNDLSLLEISGTKIKDMLEYSVKNMERDYQKEDSGKYSPVGEFGGFLHIAGMKFDVDLNVESPIKTDEFDSYISIEGKRRVSNILIYNKKTSSYEAIDDNKTYKMVISDYLANGGNGYSMLSGENVLLDKIVTDSQSLIDYVKNELNSNITSSYISSLLGRINIK